MRPDERPRRSGGETDGLPAVVDRTLELLRTRRGSPDPAAISAALEHLRHHAGQATTDPELRATILVACAHLRAGDLEEADFALHRVALDAAPS